MHERTSIHAHHTHHFGSDRSAAIDSSSDEPRHSCQAMRVVSRHWSLNPCLDSVTDENRPSHFSRSVLKTSSPFVDCSVRSLESEDSLIGTTQRKCRTAERDPSSCLEKGGPYSADLPTEPPWITLPRIEWMMEVIPRHSDIATTFHRNHRALRSLIILLID